MGGKEEGGVRLERYQQWVGAQPRRPPRVRQLSSDKGSLRAAVPHTGGTSGLVRMAPHHFHHTYLTILFHRCCFFIFLRKIMNMQFLKASSSQRYQLPGSLTNELNEAYDSGSHVANYRRGVFHNCL